MATARGDWSAPLIEALRGGAERFDFFQAVRLLEIAAGERAGEGAVGEDNPPARETVRFVTQPSLAFAGTDVRGLERGPGEGEPAPRMAVSFLGFVGTAGVLPQHYTTLLIERLQLRDPTLRDLLDLFHHRLLSLFYRAWCKYRFPVAFEREVRNHGREDMFTGALHALVGSGLEPLRGRRAIDDAALVFEGGHFARRVRTASGLARMLSDQLGVAVRIEELVGRWLEIPTAERCVLPRSRERGDQRVALGGGATLGARVWDVQSKVRIVLGPMSFHEYEHLAPGGRGYAALLSLAGSYLGHDIDFAVSSILREGECPGTRLRGREAPRGSCLGRDAWLESRTPSHARRGADFPGGQCLVAGG